MRNVVRSILPVLCAVGIVFGDSCNILLAASSADPMDPSLKADDSDSTMLEKSEPPPVNLSRGQLSARASELADLTGIGKIYAQLRHEQDQAKHVAFEAKSIEGIQRNQRIVYLHDKLNQYFMTANLEINSTIAKLNSAMSALGDRKATLADERARILRRNTFINLISGGLTKIGGYSNALTEGSLIPTNVLEIFDGGVQTSLSASTIKQQRDEKKFSRSTPDMLLAFINGNSSTAPQYPSSVWAYLNAKANANDRASRRMTLVERWRASGRLSPGGSLAKRKQAPPTQSKTITFDDLDDTITMLADIRAVVAGAEVSLMELSETLKGVYEDDPSI